jgi:hypothetical protein
MLFVIVFLEAEGNSGRNKKCEMVGKIPRGGVGK